VIDEGLKKDPFRMSYSTKNTGEIVYRKPMDTVTKDERYSAKRFRHGLNYGEQAEKVSDTFLKDGFIVSTEECQVALDAILKADPEVLDYQRGIRMELMRSPTRTLVSAWGRKISFEYERMGDDIFRRGYAFKPQSECNDIMVQWGLKPGWKFFKANPAFGRINQDGHDSLLMSVDPLRAWDIAAFLKANLEQVVEYDGVELVIPVEFQLGSTWMMEVEWKRLPSRAEMTERAVEVWEKAWNQKFAA